MTQNMAENYPKTIYKYRSWSNKHHQNIVCKNQVFMAPPIDFNDPFDCRISKNHFLINTPEKIEKYVNDGIEKHREWLVAEGKNIEEEKKYLAKRLQDLKTYQREYEELEFNEMDNHYGILSLSARWNSILMWSHYGDFHKGFCIGFNEEKMRNSSLFGKGGPVSYSDNFPEIDPRIKENRMVTSFYQTHHKAKDWNYEEEYRLTKLYFPNKPSQEDRIVNVPEQCIVEINLGVNISAEHKAEILEVAKRKNIRIFQLFKVPFKFELNRIEI